MQFDETLVGTVIDRCFRITRLLGQGGMGAAFQAEQTDLQREVCIKFLKSEALSESENLKRFKREARVLSRLRHKHIVICYSFGVLADLYPYLVLQLVDGRSLKELLNQQLFDWRRASRITIQLCSALSYAHNNGFVHRDIKPDNIMLTGEHEEEEVKIIDFGLVGKQHGENSDVSTLTQPGSIMGSVNYMAPEAFTDGVSDKTLDIYAVGSVLYEMLSGRLPFEADSPMAVMYKHINERLPELPGNVASESVRKTLEELIWSATAKDRQDRIRNCDEISSVLSELLKAEVVCENEPNLRKNRLGRNRLRSGIRVSALVGVAVASAIYALSHMIKPPSVGTSESPGKSTASESPHSLPELVTTANDTALRPADWARIHKSLSSLRNAVKITRSTWTNYSSDRRNSDEDASQTKHLLRVLQEFLYQDGFRLIEAPADILSVATGVICDLTQLSSSLKSQGKSELAKTLEFVTCDLCTCCGYYEASTSIITSGALHLRLGVLARRTDLVELQRFITDGLLKCDATRGASLDRVRPAMYRCGLLDIGEQLFQYYVRQAGRRSDRWQPDLNRILTSVKFKSRETEIELSSFMVEQQIIAGDTVRATAMMEHILTLYPFCPGFQESKTILVADQLNKVGQLDRALTFLNIAINKAKQRNLSYSYCQNIIASARLCAMNSKWAQCESTLGQFLTSKEWASTKEVLFSESIPPKPVRETVSTVLSSLGEVALYSREEKSVIPQRIMQKALAEYRQVVVARKFDDFEYAMDCYFCVKYHSYAHCFSESLVASRILVSAFASPNVKWKDHFFELAGYMELGHRLWLVGKQSESESYFAKAIPYFPLMFKYCDSGYIDTRVQWFEQAGFHEFAKKNRSLIRAHSQPP